MRAAWEAALLLLSCTGISLATVGCRSANHSLSLNESVVLESPNFPAPYPDNAECQWNITVPSAQVAHVRILTFQLQTLNNDHLKFYITKGGNLFWDCGVQPCDSADIYSPSTTLFVEFTSDSSFSQKGFSMTVTAEQAPVCPSANLTAGSGQRGLSTGAVVGLVVGLACVCAALLIACCRKRKSARPTKQRRGALAAPAMTLWNWQQPSVYAVPPQGWATINMLELQRGPPATMAFKESVAGDSPLPR